jgi:hypothetical protein
MVGGNAKAGGICREYRRAWVAARVLDSRHNLRMILFQVLVFIFVSDGQIPCANLL